MLIVVNVLAISQNYDNNKCAKRVKLIDKYLIIFAG